MRPRWFPSLAATVVLAVAAIAVIAAVLSIALYAVKDMPGSIAAGVPFK
jgi:hypothetical protein